jgi:hypothetical protein
MKSFADIHCHPTLHPFAYNEAGMRRKSSLWWDNRPKKRQRIKAFPEYFQSSIPALVRGNVRLIVAALYPLEQAWFDPEIFGTGTISDMIARYLISFLPVRYINIVQSPSFNYYEYLKKEYAF